MFHKINESTVQSQKGFFVTFSHAQLTYREGKKILTVDIEHLVEPSAMTIYKETFRFADPRHSNKAISKEEKNAILKNIEESLKFLKVNYEIR